MFKRNLASVILLTAAICWGAGFVGQTLGTMYNSAFIFNACRFFIGAIIILPIAVFFEKDHPSKGKRRQTEIAAFFAGTVLFLASATQQFATGLTFNPGKCGFLTGLYTIITPICYFLIYHRRSGIKLWIGAGLALGGLFLLCFDGTAGFEFGLGETLLILSSFCWAGHIMVVDRFVVGASPIKFSVGQFFVCSAWNLLASLLFEQPSVENIVAGKWPILFCGVVSVGMGFTCQVVGQKLSDDPTKATILLSTEALFSGIMALLWNGLPIPEYLKVDASMNIYGIFGCVMIFAAIILAQLPVKEKFPKGESLPRG